MYIYICAVYGISIHLFNGLLSRTTGQMLFLMTNQQCQWTEGKLQGTSTTPDHNRFMALFLGPSGWAGARRELLDFMVQEKITEADTPTIRLGATPSGLTTTQVANYLSIKGFWNSHWCLQHVGCGWKKGQIWQIKLFYLQQCAKKTNVKIN